MKEKGKQGSTWKKISEANTWAQLLKSLKKIIFLIMTNVLVRNDTKITLNFYTQR